ncbi:AN1-type zinc finger protein 2A isoform X2 [Pan paniscus]|uniref:AN1-type zinc finger protein 2A isoform X2 n=1 Tax=Pan paniscus TaxID=9597 RepID=UPI0024372432|nr:AN1-type zinc finger protein 2A isoform X2 [Pan paniscus]
MEFPDLGKHCSEKTCKQLDFLPVKCDACKQDFCKDHFTYAAHKCPFAFQKDVHVPVCPLCNTPIPVKKGQIPDVVVGDHIDRDCDSHPGKKKEKLSLLWLCPGTLSLWRSLKPLRHHSSLAHPLLPHDTASLAGGSPSTAPRPPHRYALPAAPGPLCSCPFGGHALCSACIPARVPPAWSLSMAMPACLGRRATPGCWNPPHSPHCLPLLEF